MAIEYNTEGSTDANAWSGSGFANGATLIAGNPGGPWTTNLDQRATNIEYLDITNAFAANIGSESSPLRFEANTSGDEYLRYRPSGGKMWVYAQNGTGDSKIENADIG